MKRVPVPDGNGGELGWFEFRDIGELNSDHQEEYLDLADELRDKKRQALAALEPVNPAVMPDPADDSPVTLTRKETAQVRDLVTGWVLAGSSFGLPLPKPMPLPAANVLRREMEKYYGALNGEIPKESPGSASTSGTTSADPATAPLPESGQGPSATASGS